MTLDVPAAWSSSRAASPGAAEATGVSESSTTRVPSASSQAKRTSTAPGSNGGCDHVGVEREDSARAATARLTTTAREGRALCRRGGGPRPGRRRRGHRALRALARGRGRGARVAGEDLDYGAPATDHRD